MEVIEQIKGFLANPLVQSVLGVVFAEFALRYKKSEKPLSLIRAGALVFRQIGQLMVFIADLTDKVLPQRLK